jgi:hypothetical protein
VPSWRSKNKLQERCICGARNTIRQFRLSEREAVADGLVEDLLPVYRKLMVKASDGEIARQAEQSATVMSQTILGRYILLKGRLVIIPKTIGSV